MKRKIVKRYEQTFYQEDIQMENNAIKTTGCLNSKFKEIQNTDHTSIGKNVEAFYMLLVGM